MTRLPPALPNAELIEAVHPRDGVWLQDRAENLMVINSVMTFDRMEIDELRRVWLDRVMAADDGRRYPRFSRLVVRQGRKAWWQEDPAFDIARHIFSVEDAALRTREGLQEYIGRQASLPLPSDRPLWQWHFIPEFGDGGSALVSRIHHVMGDGMALIPVLFSMMDVGETNQEPPQTRGTPGAMWLVQLKALLVGGPLLLYKALKRADQSVLHGPPLDGQKRVAWTPAIDLAHIKEIKNQRGCTVNDILMAVVSGGVRRYGERQGSAIRGFRVSMPVNVRPPSAPPTMDNRFGAVMVELPVDIGPIDTRLQVIKARMNALKRSVEPFVYYGSVTFLLKVLPRRVGRWLVDFYAKKCSAVMSNVPGPQEPLTISGSRVRAMLFWVPQRSTIGLGISILSFSGEVRIGLFADHALVQNPAELVADIEAELVEICGAESLMT